MKTGQQTNMRRMRVGVSVGVALCAAMVLPGSLYADVPRTLTQQGRLFDLEDKPVNGPVEVVFTLYDGETPATSKTLWTEKRAITFEDGYFSVGLGEVTPLDEIALNGEPRWLGVKVGADEEMTPRAAVRSVPYALVAGNVTGAITPQSVSIPGAGLVIDENGKWVGDPTGLVGPMGPQGAMGSPDTPQDVLTKFNSATTNGGTTTLGPLQFASASYDLRWAMQHAAASAACAAASPIADSVSVHVVIPHQGGATCANSCANATGGVFPNCRTSIAVGSLNMTQATAYTDVVGVNYNYGCNSNQAGYDEVLGQGLTTSITAYCCCYK